MPTPKRDPVIQETIRQWVEKNPDRWYTARYEDINVETGVFRCPHCIAIFP